eukprot:XP_001696364.1 predicted protein [Chlamydomonas reinhardtii]
MNASLQVLGLALGRSWDDVPLQEDAKEPLKAASLGPHELADLLRVLNKAVVVTLVNGHLHLRPDQALQVTGRNVLLSDLTIEAARARVDIGLVSVLGGTARLTRCRLVNPCPHVALLVGGGARAELWHSEVAGSGGAGVLALGPGVVVAVHHCRVADTAGTCVHVGGGASAVLSSSELLRSGLFCGLVAQGPGSRVEAQRLVVDGATESNVFVEQGAGVLLQDSRLTHSVERQGLQARGRGSVAELQRCVLSGNGQSGAYVLSGAAVKLQGCTLQGNGISGLMAGGSGSRAQLAGCQLAANAGAGVHVVGGAEAELDGCEVTGAPADQPAPAPAISADGAAGEVPPPPPPLIRAQGEGSRVVGASPPCVQTCTPLCKLASRPLSFARTPYPRG